jgi:hypothetical protein
MAMANLSLFSEPSLHGTETTYDTVEHNYDLDNMSRFQPVQCSQ